MQVYVERPIISLRGTTFQTRIHTTQCGSCDFVGNVKYDVFLHNVRIHRRCIICELDCYTKKGIMDHLASVHDEKVNCDMCDFQVSFWLLIFGGKILSFLVFSLGLSLWETETTLDSQAQDMLQMWRKVWEFHWLGESFWRGSQREEIGWFFEALFSVWSMWFYGIQKSFEIACRKSS